MSFHLVLAGVHLVHSRVHSVVHVVSVMLVNLVVELVHHVLVALLHHLFFLVHPPIHTVVHVVLYVVIVDLVHLVVAVVGLLLWLGHHIHHLLVPGHHLMVVVLVFGGDIVLKAWLGLTLEHSVLVVHVPPGLVLALEHALVVVQVVQAFIQVPHVLIPFVACLVLLNQPIDHVVTCRMEHVKHVILHIALCANYLATLLASCMVPTRHAVVHATVMRNPVLIPPVDIPVLCH